MSNKEPEIENEDELMEELEELEFFKKRKEELNEEEVTKAKRPKTPPPLGNETSDKPKKIDKRTKAYRDEQKRLKLEQHQKEGEGDSKVEVVKPKARKPTKPREIIHKLDVES